jgi:hypothetical protein
MSKCVTPRPDAISNSTYPASIPNGDTIFFVLAGSDGFTHQFELYSGQENQKRLETEPNLGTLSFV